MFPSLFFHFTVGSEAVKSALKSCVWPKGREFHRLFSFFFSGYFLAVVGLHCCMRTFSSCSKQGLLFIVICGLLIAVAPPVAEQALGRMGFSSCDLWTQELRLVGSGAQAQ